MSSSLLGIYNAQRALNVNQAALNIINNNISNMNTVGYSKQRVDLSQFVLQSSGVNIPIIAASLGAGVNLDGVSRNRDIYLDNYYRTQNTDMAFYKELNANSGLIEDVSNELSDTGILTSVNDFYNAAKQLSLNPTDSVTRSDYISKAQDLCVKFNQTYSQLTDLRTNLVGDGVGLDKLQSSSIYSACTDLNSKLGSLAELNREIALSSSQGLSPNGLLDKRDLLLDQISEYLPVTINQEANNQASVSLNGISLVSGKDQIGYVNATMTSPTDLNNPVTLKIQDKNSNDIVSNVNNMVTSGKIGALLQLGGSDPTKLNINSFINKLDTLAVNFATEINNIQTYNDGTNYAKYIDKTTGKLVTHAADVPTPVLNSCIFVESNIADQANYGVLNAGNIQLNTNISSDPFKIAAARTTIVGSPDTNINGTGDGSNALLMSQQRNSNVGGLGNTTVEKYLSSAVGDIGVKIEGINDKYDTQSSIIDQITLKRESSMGVNLDEELTDLVKYQRAYEASAKVFNTVNSILDQVMKLGQ